MGSRIITMQRTISFCFLSFGYLIHGAPKFIETNNQGLEQAPYKLVQQFDGFEERSYPSMMWVCTRVGGFMSLFRYISGGNDRNRRMAMTAPVMNTVSEKGTETCFYIPEEFQSNPPKPTGNGVYLSKKEGRKCLRSEEKWLSQHRSRSQNIE